MDKITYRTDLVGKIAIRTDASRHLILPHCVVIKEVVPHLSSFLVVMTKVAPAENALYKGNISFGYHTFMELYEVQDAKQEETRTG